MGHLSKPPLNLLEIHEIGPVDTSESKQQNYNQIWHLYLTYQRLLGLSHVSWHSPVVDCTVDDRQMGHVNQVGQLSKTPLNLLEIHEIGPVDTSESKQQNYDQI